jgi:hypothetical protein
MMTNNKSKIKYYERLKSIAEAKGGKLISTKYGKAKDKYSFQCKEGHDFELTADKVVGRGDWCPYCAGRYGDFQKKYEEIIEGRNGKMLSVYVNAKTLIKCSCEKGHEFYMLPSNILAGKWCKQCNISHGEMAVESYLKNRDLDYKKEYTFENLKGKRNALPFDFAVFLKDKLVCLIEYDGEQHFRPLRHSENYERNLKKFYQTVEHDKKKDEYCLKNKIPLIRISCLDISTRRMKRLQKDVSDILDLELTKYLC